MNSRASRVEKSALMRSSNGLEASHVTSQPRAKFKGYRTFPATTDCAFPDNSHPPALRSQSPDIPVVSFHVVPEFFLPENCIGFRDGSIATTFMAMPETAVNEDRCPVSGQNDVGPARELRVMESEAEACTVQRLSKTNLRCGVLSPDARHHAGTGICVHDIGQRLRPSCRYAT